MKPNRLIALAVTAGIAAAAVGTVACSKTSPSVTPSGTAGHTTTTQPPHPESYSAQVVLPFDYDNHPTGVAVDTAGDVYVLDYYYGDVWELAPGTNALTKPFTHLGQSTQEAVDSGGTLYVVDSRGRRVLKLAPGANAPTVLPFTGLNGPGDLAVDTRGNVYVVDDDNFRVLKLPAQ